LIDYDYKHPIFYKDWNSDSDNDNENEDEDQWFTDRMSAEHKLLKIETFEIDKFIYSVMIKFQSS
jgi:hypothetical protein